MTELKTKLPHVPRSHSIMNALKFVKNPIPIIMESVRDYGDTFSFYMGGVQRAILSTNPDFNQHVLQKNNKNYQKSFVQTDLFARYVGNGLLTSTGDYWLRQRRLIQPGFHRKKIANLTDIINPVIENYFKGLDIKEGKSIDIYVSMMELTFTIIAKSLFSTSVNEKDVNILSENISTVQKFLVKQIRQPYLNWWFNLSGQVKKHLEITSVSDQIIWDIINDRKKTKESYDDLLDMLLASRYSDTGEGMTEKQLVDESVILFVAGHETTANAMAWISYLLSKNPKVVEKLRQEYKEHLAGKMPGFEDLKNLTYTKNVINEAMRLYPPAWITDRVALEDDEINGIEIPKGTMVMSFIYGAHRDPQYWTEPNKFIPERFDAENIKQKPSFSYFPFGGGPRLCIGNNFSMMEMQLILAYVIPHYDFELIPNQEIITQPLVTLRPKNGILLNLTPNNLPYG